MDALRAAEQSFSKYDGAESLQSGRGGKVGRGFADAVATSIRAPVLPRDQPTGGQDAEINLGFLKWFGTVNLLETTGGHSARRFERRTDRLRRSSVAERRNGNPPILHFLQFHPLVCLFDIGRVSVKQAPPGIDGGQLRG